MRNFSVPSRKSPSERGSRSFSSHFLYSSSATAVFSWSGASLFLHLRARDRAADQAFADKADRALHLLDRGLGVNLRRMLQIRFRLRDHFRECLPFACADSGSVSRAARTRARRADRGCSRGSGCKPAGSNLRSFSSSRSKMSPSTFSFRIRRSTLFAPVSFASGPKAVQLFAKRFCVRQFLRARLRGVIGQLVVETMIAQFRRLFRMRPESLLDVIVCQLLETDHHRGWRTDSRSIATPHQRESNLNEFHKGIRSASRRPAAAR